MLDIADAILPDIQTAVSPIPCELYRDDTAQPRFVWVRPPSTNPGPYRHATVFKGGLLTIDIWDYSWAGVDVIEGQLAFLEDLRITSHGDAKMITFEKNSSIPLQEPDSCHRSLTYTISFADMRRYA